MKIDTLETVQLGGIAQRIRIRSTDTANPVLLLMQQGPGLPIINEVRRFERLLRLEDAFTVVYWDQRGTGLSALPLRKRGLISTGFEISPRHMVDDAVELLELLRDRFGGKTFIAGFSFGATFAAKAAVRRPDLVAAVVATGMDIDVPLAETNAYDFALTTARQRGNRRAIRQLKAIGPPPHLDVKKFSTRARWATNFGGVQSGASFIDFDARSAGEPGPLARLLGHRHHQDDPRDNRVPGGAAAASSPTRTWSPPCPGWRCRSSWRRAALTRWRRPRRRSDSTTR